MANEGVDRIFALPGEENLDLLEALRGSSIEVVLTRHEQGAGARLLWLPAYSPDFNPIEQHFANLKAHLRKAAARTVDQLWQEIGCILSSVPANECANYCKNAGYVSV